MSKSLVQMVNELFTRVAALEAKLAQQRIAAIVPELPALQKLAEKQEKPARAMCPKCGVKPNYFFHVKTCSGSQKEQKNAETTFRRRDQGTT